MRLPPPTRITAPVVALTFGLIATWFDYRLNLDLDLGRHLREIRERASSSGTRLALRSATLIMAGEQDDLKAEVKAIPDVPEIQIVGVVDETGRILADSTGQLLGRMAGETRLSPAAALINPAALPLVEQQQESQGVISAHPFRLGERGIGWALQVFDRNSAIAAARHDARTQLGWMASAMGLLSLALWAVLHFGFATRLTRLANSVLSFGEGQIDSPPRIEGGDEVAMLSGAISAMAAQLHQRQTDQLRLEREVLDISERERRRIGHDLHDSLGQRLTAASMSTNALITALKTGEPALAQRAEDIGQQLREAIGEVRSLSHGLAPVALGEEGLREALTSLAETTSRGAGTLRCIFENAEPLGLVDVEIAEHLYRITQEAVNNALKHGSCSEIRISLVEQEHELLLEVDDDGEGFDDRIQNNVGIGLRVMRYRAKLLGGNLEISSPPAGGTRISCRVPSAL
jgi:signal transduction histidine kinase